ncbi:hypothetical protein RRG08_002205 [Elysia crispata]|uniref:Uncharacterized protein n=1 Tax=Elysia crispata TaxID=231223 RepID=A0AAE1DD19_9GAST|nr:hypothetical protein RRG08_002205 [Elysia crispata]
MGQTLHAGPQRPWAYNNSINSARCTGVFGFEAIKEQLTLSQLINPATMISLSVGFYSYKVKSSTRTSMAWGIVLLLSVSFRDS